MIKLIKDTIFDEKDIVKFVLKCPADVFDSARRWDNNFRQFVHQLYKNNYFMVFYEGKKITGLCGWAFLTKEDSLKINKVRWDLPLNINANETLYVALAILNNCTDIYKVRSRLKEMCLKRNVEEVIWFSKNKWYRKDIINENSELRNC